MRFEGFIINLDHAHKNFKRLIGLFIQQEIETLDVIGVQPTGWSRDIALFVIAKACKEVAECGREEQQPRQQKS